MDLLGATVGPEVSRFRDNLQVRNGSLLALVRNTVGGIWIGVRSPDCRQYLLKGIAIDGVDQADYVKPGWEYEV